MSKQAFKRLRKHIGLKASREEMENYAWPGGYDLIYYCGDGGVLCGDCVNQNIEQIDEAIRDKQTKDQWYVHAVESGDVLEQNIDCDHCGYSMGPEAPDDSQMAFAQANPLGSHCPLNGCGPDVASERDFRRFVAYGVMRSWLPSLLEDDREAMPLPVAHEYVRQSTALRHGFLSCVSDAIQAWKNGDIEPGSINRPNRPGWDHSIPEAEILLDTGDTLNVAWRLELIDNDFSLCFSLDTSTNSIGDGEGQAAWLCVSAFEDQVGPCLAYLAKADSIMGGDHGG